jgi:Mn-dependent DtxR family transcriptional regulator
MLFQEAAMDVKDSVLSAIKKEGKPLKIGEIAAIAGIDRKEADKIKKLKREGLIESPKNCYYSAK